MAKYKIAFSCAFKEFWRYNLYITGKVFRGDECVEFIDHSDIIAEVGTPLTTTPVVYNRKRTTTINTTDGDALTLYIYIVANTLPKTNRIAEAPPFECSVRISNDEQQIFERRYKVDQWSGNNIEIKI